MLRVGVTGGIAAGKSTAVEALRQLGAVVVDADAIARSVLVAGAPAVAEIADAFGDGVLDGSGGVDRPALARLVFADPGARARLEAITHPRIRAVSAQRFAEAAADAVVVHDIPLLVELDLADRYHLVVVVNAPADERVARLVRDRRMAVADAAARVSAQADDGQRRAAADVWLDNTADPAGLVEQITAVWRDRLVPFQANLQAGRRADRPGQPVVVDPDPSWAAQGERLVARVRRAAGSRALDVAHVGSTAVPGLDAKDILDLQVVVADLAAAQALAADLSGAGLVPVNEPRWDRPIASPSQRLPKAFAANADPGRAVNCHIRPAGSPVGAEVLAVRDRLRSDPAARAAYARLKHDLASREWPDIDAYADAKTPFLADLMGSAPPPPHR